MEWYGEKMLPRGLPELVYQITPPEILKDLKVISFNRKKKKGGGGCIDWINDHWRIKLYPTVLLASGFESYGTQSFRYWYIFLKTMLHEIGHATTSEMISRTCRQRYDHDSQCHKFIEDLADRWRDNAIEKIAYKDPRLGQPIGWIGGLPGVYLLKGIRISRRDDLFGTFKNKQIKNFRAKKCDGQYGIDDIVQMGWIKPYEFPALIIRRRMYRTIKRVASNMGITRTCFDGAGRKHLFFNDGEAKAISAEVRKAISLKRWAKEEMKRYEEEKKAIRDNTCLDDIPF